MSYAVRLLLSLGLLAAVCVRSRAGEVVNGSFSAGMVGWQPAYVETGAPPAAVDRAVFRGADMASLCLSAETGRRGLWFQGSIPRDAQVARYRFTLWYRCQDLGPDWIIRVALVACKGDSVTKWLQNSHIAHGQTVDWTSVSVEATVPPEATHLGVYIGLWYADALAANPPPGGGRLWYDDLAVTPVAPATVPPAPPAAPEQALLTDLWPLGEKGLFTPGQPVQLLLLGGNPTQTAIRAEITLRVSDFLDQPVCTQSVPLTLEPGKPFRQTLDLAALDRCGAFVVRSVITREGKQELGPSTSFCVIRRPVAADPYFVCDVNGAETELVPAMQMIGVSGRKIGTVLRNVPPEQRQDLTGYWKALLAGGLKPYWDSSLNLIGNIYLGNEFLSPRYKPEIERRRQLGLFPYPDECFAEFGDFVEGAARAMKGRVHYWVLSEEIDGTVTASDLPGGSQTAEFMRYVMMSRLAYQRLKQVDPDCEVIGLAVSSDFNQTPRWPIVRRLLPDLKEYTDIIGPDLYTDSWNWVREVSRGPEEGGMREKLLEVLAFQKSLGKKPVTTVSERGYGLALHLPPDHPQDRLQAQLTARSLILGKSVPGVLFYTLHMMCGSSGWQAKSGKTSDDANPLLDLGLWQAGYDRQVERFAYRPRSAVAAYATVARLLAGSSDCTEVLPQSGVYTYTFRCPGQAVTALWTTDPPPVTLQLELPASLESTDLMGQTRPLPKGMATLQLTASPQFLSGVVAPEALVGLLRQARLPGRSPLKATARLLDLSTLTIELANQSATPLPVDVRLDTLAGATPAAKALAGTVPANGALRLVSALTQVDLAQLGELRGSVTSGDTVLPLCADLSATPVPPAPAALKLDGDLTEWQGRIPLRLDQSRLLPGPEVVTKRLWTGPDDLAAEVYLAWDANGLYLAAQVHDDVHLQRQTGDQIWRNDCLQFAFDMLNDAAIDGRRGYDANDYNLAVALTESGPQSFCFVDHGQSDRSGPRDVPLAIKRSATMTTYEMALPWTLLTPFTAQAGKVFRFSLVIFDVDAPTEAQAPYWLGLTAGIANGQDPSQYRVFALTR